MTANTPEIIVCACGKSSRFSMNKLLFQFENGNSVLHTTLSNIVNNTNYRCTVIIPPQQPELLQLVEQFGATALVMQPASNGLGETIAFAVNNLHHAAGWLICLADMPFIPAEIYNKICELTHLNKIIAPSYKNRRGHPVYFPKRFYPQLISLSGDKGASSIINRFENDQKLFPVSCQAVVEDIDVMSDLDNLSAKYLKS